MADFFFYVAVVGCIAVLIVLMVGVGNFARGGRGAASRSNRIMRLRVILQGVAILLILAAAYFGGRGG